MADEKHLDVIRQGVESWNKWRNNNPEITPHLSHANLSYANLMNADFSEADLRDADLTRADMIGANFEFADLSGANLSHSSLSGADFGEADLCNARLVDADLTGANLSSADLRGTSLSKARLGGADLSGASLVDANLSGAQLSGVDLDSAELAGADLTGADLKRAKLVGTDLSNAILTGCEIYGIAAWDLTLDGAEQKDLVITTGDEPTITVDNLEVAQFIYLLLNNRKIREVIDTISSKVVLILGRFTPDRLGVLEAIRSALREYNYSPVLFDFEKPSSRDLTETISTLAHMARFVIADITEAKSIPQELQAIVPNLPSVPIQPILLMGEREYSMFEHFKRYPWVLDPFLYANVEQLIKSLHANVIVPAEARAKEMRG